MNALKELYEWAEKGRHVEIHYPGGYMPGDYWFVSLKERGREIIVDEQTLGGGWNENFSVYKEVTLEEMIIEALRQWKE